MTRIAYGCESTVNDEPPTQHWYDDLAVREESIQLASQFMRTSGSTAEVKLRRLLRVDGGPLYVEDGPPALHVKWRRTKFRASHKTRYCYTEHLALVDVINGHVILLDSDQPVDASFHAEWPKEQCLDEYVTNADATMGRAFWPKLRAARPDEQCHYVVVNSWDCTQLQFSRPSLRPEQLTSSYKLPAFA